LRERKGNRESEWKPGVRKENRSTKVQAQKKKPGALQHKCKSAKFKAQKECKIPDLAVRFLTFGSIHDLAGSIPDLAGSIPNLVGSIPDLVGSIPDLAGSIPDLAGSILDLVGSIPDLAWFDSRPGTHMGFDSRPGTHMVVRFPTWHPHGGLPALSGTCDEETQRDFNE
jgi:hypothetical protein